MEKLSPILAFYVEDGVERGAARCFEILSYGGMGHTAGVHTRSREIAIAYGREMPASRVVVNTPTTHGAIGFSTALPPSMTLGCGSWGGNVTSDNISPIHLMDIKRVAFETRAVASKRPARSGATTQAATSSVRMNAPAPSSPPQHVAAQGGRINREEVAAIVDRFLAGRGGEGQSAPRINAELHATSSPPPVESVNEINPNWIDTKSAAAPHAEAAPTARDDNGNSRTSNAQAAPRANATGNGNTQASSNGRKAVDFVAEDDVRRAILKGEKIYVNPKTIITPSAHDIGDPAEVFAKA
jgi:hypothetical protein